MKLLNFPDNCQFSLKNSKCNNKNLISASFSTFTFWKSFHLVLTLIDKGMKSVVQPAFTFSKSTVDTPEECVKYVQS